MVNNKNKLLKYINKNTININEVVECSFSTYIYMLPPAINNKILTIVNAVSIDFILFDLI
jgi:hypothetical protein